MCCSYSVYIFFVVMVIMSLLTDRPEPIDAINSTVIGVTRLQLNWTAPFDNFAKIDEYLVEFRLMGTFNFSDLRFSETVGSIPVDFNRTYIIRVSACNNAGCGNGTQFELPSPRPSKLLSTCRFSMLCYTPSSLSLSFSQMMCK